MNKLNLVWKILLIMLRKLCNRQKEKPNFRKRQMNKPTWIVNNCKKAHESGQEHANNQGKLILARIFVSKKDCATKCKFNCTQKIDRETQESIFMALYKLDTNDKHSFIVQTAICSSVVGTKEYHKKLSYIYFLMKGEDSFWVCKSFYLSTHAISQKIVYIVHEKNNKLTGMLRLDGRGKHDWCTPK